MKPINDVSRDVIGAAMKIHREIGPGLLESVYETILAAKLAKIGYRVERQRALDFSYEDMTFINAFKIDLLVDDRLVVELKSTEQNRPVYGKQLLTYLRLMNLPVGLVLNFGLETLADGIMRVANDFKEEREAK